MPKIARQRGVGNSAMAVLLLFALSGCWSASRNLEISDHYDGKVFFNPEYRTMHGFFSSLKMLFTFDPAEWPEYVQTHPNLRLRENLQPDQVAVTFVNHATMLIQMNGLTVLTDPIWATRASPFSWIGPKRVRDPGIPFDELPPIDLVIISHNHYDHLSIETLQRLEKRFSPRYLVAFGDKKLLEENGMNRVTELDWWDSVEINSSTKITFTPAQHFSSRTLWDRNNSLWGSFMVQKSGKQIYFGGDSGYSSHYSTIRQRLGAPDIAFLPIGAYMPRWFMGPMHMNPAESVRAHQDLDSRISIGIHFGCFRLTEEAINQPIVDLEAARKSSGIRDDRFIVLEEGQTKVFDL